jgi:hypothetical protein
MIRCDTLARRANQKMLSRVFLAAGFVRRDCGAGTGESKRI